MTKKEISSLSSKIVNYFGIEKSMMAVLVPFSLAAVSEIVIIFAVPNKPIVEEVTKSTKTKKENV